MVSNGASKHQPKQSASLPSYEFVLNRSAQIDQHINMIGWRAPKLEERVPRPVSKLYVRERSHTLPCDIVSWTPKSPGAVAAGKRAAAVQAGVKAHVPEFMVTNSARVGAAPSVLATRPW